MNVIKSNTKCMGKSHGIKMTWQEHLDNYPNTPEMKRWVRHREILKMLLTKKVNEALNCMIREFTSIPEALEDYNNLSQKIFKGWEPL